LGCFGVADTDSRSDLNSLPAIPCSVATSEEFLPEQGFDTADQGIVGPAVAPAASPSRSAIESA